MKISKLKIRNIFGIKEYNSDGKDTELLGENGVGKTGIIDAIKLCLTNKSPRPFVIMNGQEEGEVFIQTDSGLSVHRKIRTNKADYSSIKQEGDKGVKTESFLREFFTELQLNPVEFTNMDEKEQNRIILDLIDFKWDMNWIKEQFGEIPPDVNYEQNILCVLHDIQSEEGYYFKKRQDINRECRNNQAFIEKIGSSLPQGYEAKKWEETDLGSVYEKIEAIRNHNDRITKAKAVMSECEAKLDGNKNWLEKERQRLANLETGEIKAIETCIVDLQNQIKALQAKIPEVQKTYSLLHTNAEQQYKTGVAEIEALMKANGELSKQELKDFSSLKEEAQIIEAMKGYIKEYNRMVELGNDVTKLTAKSEELTAKIEKARTLPGEILAKSNIPVEGLSIQDGRPLINGLPISNLSEGEKMELCISVATQNPNALQMLLLDGVEKLATGRREKVYAQLKKKGVQFIATRTTDDNELTIIEL